MTGERDLARLLGGMGPHLNSGRYVFTCVEKIPKGVTPVVTVTEDEGLTLVARQEEADKAGLEYDYVAGWITLRVRSSLEAVGLTAAVSAELAEAGISCNVVAGFHHDHLFVPHDRVVAAIELLDSLAARYL